MATSLRKVILPHGPIRSICPSSNKAAPLYVQLAAEIRAIRWDSDKTLACARPSYSWLYAAQQIDHRSQLRRVTTAIVLDWEIDELAAHPQPPILRWRPDKTSACRRGVAVLVLFPSAPRTDADFLLLPPRSISRTMLRSR